MRAAEFARRRARIEHEACGRGAKYRRALNSLVRRSGAITIIVANRIVGYRLGDGVACSKQRYRSLDGAHDELRRIHVFGRHAHIPVRAYQCEHCNGWHLTSRVEK